MAQVNKSEINMMVVAAWLGFFHDKAEGKKTAIFRHEGLDLKAALYDNGAHGWKFYEAHTEKSGDVFDLAQLVLGCDFKSAKQAVLEAIGSGYTMTARKPQKRVKSICTPDYERFKKTYSASRTGVNEYLLKRGISAATQALAGDNLRTGTSTALFFHTDHTGQPTGYEYKAEGKTGFSKYGFKYAFKLPIGDCSQPRYVVIVETAIDALSFAEIFNPCEGTLIISTGGKPSSEQMTYIKRLTRLRVPPVFINAQDADQGGDDMAAQFERLLTGCRVVRRRPDESKGKDWNDVLKSCATENK